VFGVPLKRLVPIKSPQLKGTPSNSAGSTPLEGQKWGRYPLRDYEGTLGPSLLGMLNDLWYEVNWRALPVVIAGPATCKSINYLRTWGPESTIKALYLGVL